MNLQLPVLTQTDKVNQTLIAIIKPADPEVKPPEPIKYKVLENETLTSIADSHQTTVQRLWQANTQLTDPNTLEVNQELTVPLNTDVLQPREMPMSAQVSDNVRLNVNSVSSTSSGASSSNTYTPGYCTYGVKQWRPDLPNNLGNADRWYINYQGAKGSTPAVGAVAVAISYMHVALVLEVNGETVTVREMNYGGLWKVSTRTARASEFRYLY